MSSTAHTGSYRGPDQRYEPPRDPFITKTTVYGAPDAKKASTSYSERLNGTMRHFNGGCAGSATPSRRRPRT